MRNVKKAIADGVSIEDAVRGQLLGTRGMTMKAFAAKHDLRYQGVVKGIKGSERPTTQMLEACVAELGGTVEEWRDLLFPAREERKVASR
jgi:hypothetical protein